MNRPLKITVLCALVLGLASAATAATTIVVPTDQPTVAAAVAAANPGDTVYMLNGTHTVASTVYVDKSLTLQGESEGGVVLDYTGAGGYTLHVRANDVTLESFTIAANGPDYPIHASGTDNLPNGYDNLTIQHVTIAGTHQRTGFDIHGYNHVLLSYLTSRDATGGNGVQLTGCVDVDADHVTTSDNAWGSFAVYCSNNMGRGSDDVVVDGTTCSFGEGNIFAQDEFGYQNTNVTVTGYAYMLRNETFRPEAPGFYFYKETLADAVAAALAFTGYESDSYIYEIADPTRFLVGAGMGIQAAIDHAGGAKSSLAVGPTVTVAAGTYPGQIHITVDDLELQGAGVGSTIIQATPSMTSYFNSGAYDNYPVVFVDGATGAAIHDLTVDGVNQGDTNYRFIGVGFWNGGGSVTDANVLNVMNSTFSGAQHGVGVYAYNDDGGPYAIALTHVQVLDFQKAGVVMIGDGLTFDLDDVTTIGQGATGVTAQDGIEIGYGAVGTVDDCTISDIAYTGDTWTASGFLAYASPSFAANNVDVDNCQTSVYLQDSSGSYDGADITNPLGDALYAYSTGAKAGGAKPLSAQPFGPAAKRADKSPVVVSVGGCTVTGADATDSWGVTAFGYGPLDFTVTDCDVSHWDWGVVLYDFGGASFDATVDGSNIHDNGSYGMYSNAAETAQASCNWWGDASGPASASPLNAGSGDVVEGDVVFWPWLDGAAPGGACVAYGADNVAAVPGGEISPCNTCLTVPIEFSRTDASMLRGVSVTFQLSSELELCAGVGSVSLATGAGSLYDGYTNTNLFVIDNGGGSYTADATLLGMPCGPTVGGTLLNVGVAAATGVTGDVTGTITVTAVTVRDCDNAPLPGTPGAPATVTINNGAPGAVADLAAIQVKTGNTPPADGTTSIDLTWTDPGDPDLTTVEIWRKGFGDYPEYDDGTGAVPTAPATPAAALGNGWTHAASVAAGTGAYTDDPGLTRDFWYYVAFANDGCNEGAVSGMTGGTLNYHLGDVADGSNPPPSGDDAVDTFDISVLGANYGITIVFGDPVNYLDVGPTTDYSVDARPTTDNVVQFEDLMMFAINYGQVSKTLPHPQPAMRDLITLSAGEAAVGDELSVEVHMSGSGRVQGLSVPLTWNASVLEPVGLAPGDFLAAQGGATLVVSPRPGTVDAALFGVRDLGICGTGLMATVKFRVVGDGDPELGVGEIVARDAENKPVVVEGDTAGAGSHVAPQLSVLRDNVPNPFNPSTELKFATARSGRVTLSVFTLRGRLVRTLIDGVLPAGDHSATWDGTDRDGRHVASGGYIVRMTAPDRTQSRHITLLK